ncbi:MAG TPA: hypothetical protein VJL87_00990, partial [Bdellovibrionota bacterium]|nr:hypothetical protein [Bdellovibrionota bacterium]
MNNRLKILTFLIFSFIFLPSISFGGRFEQNLQGFSNSLLNSVTERAGLILNFKGLNGARPLGITGLTVGLEGTAGFIGTEADYQNLPTHQYIPIARLYLAKGLPFGFDLELSAVHSSILEGLGLIDPD